MMPNDRFKSLLAEDPPSFDDRIDTPFRRAPDYLSYNQRPFRHIEHDMRLLQKASSPLSPAPSRGVLIIGAPGSGKSHLLMRLAQSVDHESPVLYVRRFMNEDAVALHIWQNIVDSLQELRASGRSQLDNLLSKVFSQILIRELQEDYANDKATETKRTWIEQLQADPFSIAETLGSGETRRSRFAYARRRILGYLTRYHRETNPRIAHALISHCFVNQDNHKRIIQTWLAGQEIDPAEAKQLGLPQWISDDEASSNRAIWQAREQQALDAIHTLGIISAYDQPLVVAFDQLEGLQGQEVLTRRWGDTVREIFSRAPNFLIVTCVLPTTWQEWFESTLDKSAVDRIAQNRVCLEVFTAEDALQILTHHMRRHYERYSLPTIIYPFTKESVEEIHNRVNSPRDFLQAARQRFRDWLFESESEDLKCVDSEVNGTFPHKRLQECLDDSRKKAWNKYFSQIPVEESLYGQLREIARLLSPGDELPQASLGGRVLPANFIWSRPCGTWCLGVSFRPGISFTSRVRNLTEATDALLPRPNMLLVRDSRCLPLTPTGKNAVSEFLAAGGRYVEIDQEEIALINGIFDTLLAVEERNVSVDSTIADKAILAGFLKSSGVLNESKIFCHMFSNLLPQAATVEECVEGSCDDAPSLDGAFDTGFDVQAGTVEFTAGTSLYSPSSPFLAAAEPSMHATAVIEVSNCIDEESIPMPSMFAKCDEAIDQLEQEIAQLDEGEVTSETPDLAAAETDIEPEAVAKDNDEPDIDVQVDAVINDRSTDGTNWGVVGQLSESGRRIALSFDKPMCSVLLGYMGSGKSYGLGVLIENALMSIPGINRCRKPLAVIAFNYRNNPEARFEYGGFRQPNRQANEIERLAATYAASPQAVSKVNVFAYQPEIERRKSDYDGLNCLPIQFRADELSARHWEILMKPPSGRAEYVEIAKDIIGKLFYAGQLTLRKLERAIEQDERLTPVQLRRIQNRLSFAKRFVCYERDYDFSDVIESGSLNIFDLRMQAIENSDALKLCLILTDLIRRAKNGVNKLIVFDEAHEYVDCKELVADLENAITQIRHDGLSFVLASQFPDRIPKRIFKYLSTRLVFNLPHQEAIDYLKKSAPNLASLPARGVSNLQTEKGLCYIQSDDHVSDPDLRTPQLLEVRPRCTQHGGATRRNR